ncbi:MAG: hypothetical protein H7A24_17200 [Leptospiraceae bacterium]|nr:hypothetical protein [Leptospiraceae bacterium]
MIYSILLTLLFFALLFTLKQKQNKISSFRDFRNTIKTAFQKPLNSEKYTIIITFTVFLALPLFWGLTFFLQTDLNVLVVLFTFTWVYNWFKYTVFDEKLSDPDTTP